MHKTTRHEDINAAKIIGVQFSILSPEEIRKTSVAQITTRDTYINDRPVIGGLFDPRMGVLDPGLICPTDGLNYMQTPGYFGHIELARPVFFIQYLNTILKVCRCICIKCSKLLIDKKKYSHALNMPGSKRWKYIFGLASKISRCGEDTEDGCGTKQPKKIHKEGLATIFCVWDNIDGIQDEEGNVKDKLTMKLSCEQVLKLFRRISDEDVTFLGFSPLWSRPDWMVCQVLPVPPPAVRPSVKHDAQQRSEDDISHIIVNIIKANKTLQEKITQNANAKVIDDWTTVLQYYCATMIDNHIPGCAPVAQRTGRALKSMKERLVGKGGRVRGNLMGKRVDFSARSVITPDANIGIRELGVPLPIAKNITYPVIVNERNKGYLKQLILNGPEIHPGAKILERKSGENISLRYVDRASLDVVVGDIVHRHLINGDPVLFNRQPSLHKMSMMCHIVRILHEGNTFRLNVGVTKPYNADFDGDEMNLHAAQNDLAKAELLNLASVPRQIISPANNQSIIGIFQDSLLGAYRFTRKGINFSPRTAMNLLMRFDNVKGDIFKGDNKQISNFKILSQIFPPMSAKFPNKIFDDADDDRKTTNNIIEIREGHYLRGQIDKGVLGATSKGLIQSIFNDFGFNSSADFIDNLQNIINYYMMLSSYSVGISDLIADKSTNDQIAAAITKKKQEVRYLIDQIQLGVFENNTGKTNEEEFETKVNSILNKAQEEAGKIGRKSLSKDNRFVTMVNAGSKGNNINIAQMISCLGQQNVDGKRIPYGFDNRTLPHFTKYDDSPESRGFVENSFIEGLNPFELYFHAMGGRVGLIDTAVKTSQTGYIQRRLIKGLEDLNTKYDMTVRNNKNKIIQFEYGDDGIETTKVEAQALPLTKMTLENIYAHYQLPFDLRSSAFKSNFTRETISRMKQQKTALIAKTKELIAGMIQGRELLVEYVFKNSNDTRIQIPVNFRRIITNIQFQFKMQNNSLVDVTPLELYEMLDNTFASLKLRYVQPTDLFRLAFYYYLSPKDLLIVRHFNRNALVFLMENIILQYKKSIVSPGEMVGIIAAQSIGEPTTQMTLNTFHFAGVASKSNVTRGVPRIEELLSLSANPKKPSTTIFLKEEDQEDRLKAQEQMYLLELTSLQEVTSSVSICFDPDDLNTLIEMDKVLMTEYREFQNLMDTCGMEGEVVKKGVRSKWIIRFEFDKGAMLDKNISMSDIHFALKHSYKEHLECIYTDTNANNLVMRIRLTRALMKGKKKSLDQSDEIYGLKTLQENLLKNVILRGVKKIPKVTIRKIPNYLIMHEGNYEPREIWVLDTIGTNLEDILMLENIDINRTFSNDIQETFRVLGIEAARATIYNELAEVLEFDGTYINYHHINLLCDRIAATKKMVSIFRHGINNDDIGPLAKASFEETPEMFLRAARHAELDNMRGISANVMCGQEGYFGTNSFQVILDIAKTRMLEYKERAKKLTIGDFMGIEDPSDICSTANMSIANSTEFLETEDLGDDDDYNPGF